MVLESTARALLRRLAEEQARSRVPSLVAAIVRDGEIAWFGARGRAGGERPGQDTQYRIGSITKTFIAVAVLRLRDEGLIDLLDPLDKHVPGTPVGEVTIAQLLSHTGGLTAEPPGEWWERTPGVPVSDLLASLGPETARHRPGRRYHYSNLGYALLGEVVARKRSAPWEQVIREEILEPLGMRDTTPRPRPPHATGYAVHPWADVLLPEPEHDHAGMAPAGQLWSTAGDLARWAAFLLGDTRGVLKPETLAEMREPVTVEDGDAWTTGYGLGLQLIRHRGPQGARRLSGHGGSMPGFLASLWTDPSDGVAVVWLANTTSGVRASLATDLLDILAEHEPPLPAEWEPVQVDPDVLELTGQWYWGPAAYVLRALPGRGLSLTPLSGQGRASRFVPQPDGTWLGLDGYYAGETLRVVRSPKGVHLELNTFIFSREPYDPSAPIPGGVDPLGWR
ncbi:serine hydrolase [Thermobispora bispora]|uniref:Beta-lactamase n=1 Tax=Thermobispora bispora (strain ATCC 19993 / DSM 43833 / CBS 139.67 / JCM 10125 / KCTC 9307 / NBRC 14880 / R51) TaxID=469371 RepID=D6YBA8_THEBD|nr:serine hydrolase domain-containing protein [Thermobispora bispora]MBO2475964.1 serine hydrolase [Actinomycetales bacterium]MDI9581442.1 serine hydrolase domain-containing protein [Thermobispora sp.]ADG88468.1 beta-lactamase [Thermobispora bispora DSM 43833]MBX6167079.1 beta-lactamase family protein [Thermobispora bispora]QSI48277.1 serine hydrolase [Thermobispora bispora]